MHSRDLRGRRIAGAVPGVYLTFDSVLGVELALESLDPRQGKVHPELVAVREVTQDGRAQSQAIVFVPDGKLEYFTRRLEGYASTSEAEKPKNQNLIDRIQSIRLATLANFWTDPMESFPSGNDPVWWEVWLRKRDGNELQRLRDFATDRDAIVGQRTLAFADRVVVLVQISSAELAAALDLLDDLAELRSPRSMTHVLATEPAYEQATWVAELVGRTKEAPHDSPAATILDTGVHREHPLLERSITPTDCHSADVTWPVGDHAGHGTQMAGLALYGDLGAALASTEQIRLRHGLESVKILPPTGANPPELYGAITAAAVSRVEIQQNRPRVFSLAVTAPNPAPQTHDGDVLTGQPTSWSAALDAISAGQDVVASRDGDVILDEQQVGGRRLFLVSAGNIDDFQDDYHARCDLEPVEDPAQSWNAVTVGAYTDLDTIAAEEAAFNGWTPLAARGDISPYSRTSVAFSRAWPIKPEIVMEGGNIARSPEGGEFDWPDSFQLLTTKRPAPDPRLLTLSRQTSASTAQAANLAANILAEYPTIWPETLRALIIHSAEWTPEMRAQLDAAALRQPRDAVHRRFGMGVPSLSRATRSARDSLTLVVEDTIHPFDGEGRMREMHLNDLPWPRQALEELGDIRVRLRVTLSYFIEPNPARRGWARRYSYASHGLRFDVRRATENEAEFRKRINQLALDEQEKRPASRASDSAEWFFGPDFRSTGSLHTDLWYGTAADLARRGSIAVFPVTGWWKERPSRDHSDRGAQYALVVSIDTPETEIDIWTPVVAELGIPIDVEAE